MKTYLLALLALGYIIATTLGGCHLDLRFRPCLNTEDCGTDPRGRNLVCACDGICRATCAGPRKCSPNEVCIESFCHAQNEQETKLGTPCDPTENNDFCSNVWKCKNGALTCLPKNQEQPAKEVCNNKDDDCDGQIDEDVFETCENDCGKGVETCRAGVWGKCSAPPTERTCKTICGLGVQYCYDGFWGRCHAINARFCGSDTGECRRGIELCQFGRWTGICQESITPTTEVCDNKDNDCNGQVDDGINCP